MTRHWDVALAVVKGKNGLFLGVTRGQDIFDIGFPGGYRETKDASPFQTARRETAEETGILIMSAWPLLTWYARGKTIVAYQATNWQSPFGQLRESSEGIPGWFRVDQFTSKTCKNRAENARLIRMVMQDGSLRIHP